MKAALLTSVKDTVHVALQDFITFDRERHILDTFVWNTGAVAIGPV
jgi:hypothetical protein